VGVRCCGDKSIILLEVYNLCQLLFLIGKTLKGISKYCEKYVLEITGDGAEFFYILVNSKVCKLERGFGGLQGKGINFEEFKIK